MKNNQLQLNEANQEFAGVLSRCQSLTSRTYTMQPQTVHEYDAIPHAASHFISSYIGETELHKANAKCSVAIHLTLTCYPRLWRILSQCYEQWQCSCKLFLIGFVVGSYGCLCHYKIINYYLFIITYLSPVMMQNTVELLKVSNRLLEAQNSPLSANEIDSKTAIKFWTVIVCKWHMFPRLTETN